MKAVIREDKTKKTLVSENLNYYFNKESGLMITWGKTKNDDPEFSPFGPFIADIEISTICSGVKGVGPCKFCYKSNTSNGDNMSLETFKKLFHKFPKILTQIAFGIGDLPHRNDKNEWEGGNPEMWDIFDYCREHGVIANVTINGEGVTDEIADMLVSKCGAIAVSLYDKDKTYDTVKKLTDRGMAQTNIHFMISDQTFETAKQLINDRLNDDRLSKLNAIVFLSLKPKGRAIRNNFSSLSQEKFKELVDFALESKIGFGFDSCSATKFLKSVEGTNMFDAYKTMSEPCESTKFSSYFNTKGEFFPCSFAEGTKGWETGINIIDNENSDFIKDLWNEKRTIKFRNYAIQCTKCNKACSIFDI